MPDRCSVAAGAPLKPPAPLAAVLQAQTAWRLLDPATDLVGDWVVPFGPQRIFAVSDVFEDDTVTPMRCVDCDANVWYRWNGRPSSPRGWIPHQLVVEEVDCAQ